MKRFTRKDEFGNYIIGELNDLGFELEYDELNLVTESVNKLGKLEDLEAQLGIDLITLFNALENGVFYYNEMYREIWFTTVGIRQKWQNKDYELVSASGYEKFDLTDYGKSWFLNSEELKNKLEVID